MKALADAVDKGGEFVKNTAEVAVEAVGSAASKTKNVVETVLRAGFAPDVREDGLSGAEIYRIFHDGSPDSLHAAAATWKEIQQKYDAARVEINRAMHSIGPDWEGPAADAARAAIAPFERSLLAAQDTATRVSETIAAQARWFDHTKWKVHDLPDKPPFDPSPVQAIFLRGMEDKANEYHEKEEANRQYYREYIEASRANVDALPVFEPVPAIGTAGTAGTAVSASGGEGFSYAPTASQQFVPPATSATVPSGTADRPGPGTSAEPRPPGTATSPAVRPASTDFRPTRPAGWGGGESRFSSVASGPRDPGFGGGTPGFRSGEPAVRRPGAGFGPRPSGVMTPPGQLMPLAPGTRSGDDDERRRSFAFEGPDKWELFGTDEFTAPAVIGAPREKK